MIPGMFFDGWASFSNCLQGLHLHSLFLTSCYIQGDHQYKNKNGKSLYFRTLTRSPRIAELVTRTLLDSSVTGSSKRFFHPLRDRRTAPFLPVTFYPSSFAWVLGARREREGKKRKKGNLLQGVGVEWVMPIAQIEPIVCNRLISLCACLSCSIYLSIVPLCK